MSDQERDIAETIAERELVDRPSLRGITAGGDERFSSQRDVKAALRAERREGITKELAPAVLGMYERNGSVVKYHDWRQAFAVSCVRLADELLVELDAAEARDREATK